MSERVLYNVGSASYSTPYELLLSLLALLSLVCACRLAHALRRARRTAKTQSNWARSMDISYDSLLNNSSDHALTEFVLFMAVSDIVRASSLLFHHVRMLFDVLPTCILFEFSGILCLVEDFIEWTSICNDIVCYGVICFCLFRYLRKRSIFTRHSITSQRIQIAIVCISVCQSATQLILAVMYTHGRHIFHIEAMYVPSLAILYLTVLYIVSVFLYIRCCHPFWVLGKATARRQWIFLVVFTFIFIAPITIKLVCGILKPEHELQYTLLLISDIFLTQTGTGNFLAWYWSRRDRLMTLKHKGSAFVKKKMSGADHDGEDLDVLSPMQSKTQKTKSQNGHFDPLASGQLPPQGSNSMHYHPPSIDVMAVMDVDPIFKNQLEMSDVYDIDSSTNILNESPLTRDETEDTSVDRHIYPDYGDTDSEQNEAGM